MSLRHQAGIREKLILGARLYDTSRVFLETMNGCPPCQEWKRSVRVGAAERWCEQQRLLREPGPRLEAPTLPDFPPGLFLWRGRMVRRHDARIGILYHRFSRNPPGLRNGRILDAAQNGTR